VIQSTIVAKIRDFSTHNEDFNVDFDQVPVRSSVWGDFVDELSGAINNCWVS
jgi:hypothetical protein